jgi:hypothetical protein
VPNRIFTFQGDLVSQRHDDPATQDFATQRFSAGQGTPPPPRHPAPNEPSAKRWNIGRDVLAGVLLLIAPLFPWNLYFGIGIPDSSGALFALLAVVTVLSLVAIAVTYVTGSRASNSLAGRLRVALNAPYVLLVAGIVGFDVVQTMRYGGSGNVPGGVGPGAWLGISGALLSAQPTITGTATDDGSLRKWPVSARIVGCTSIALATLAVLFNLFWRTKAALPGSAGASGFGKQSVAIIATAVVYGVVALVPVAVAARWILQSSSRSSRLATIALGASTLAAGVVVWVLPVGREIDGFHGIAQNTSTAGVGFEGYLAWVAAAAIFAPLTLLGVATNQQIDRGVWRVAARKGLLLIAVWCLASVPIAVRQRGDGHLRCSDRGACALASQEPRQPLSPGRRHLISVRSSPGAQCFSHRAGHRLIAPNCRYACRGRQPGVRKQSRPADHQHLRCRAQRASLVHPRRGHHHRTLRTTSPTR